MKSWKQQLQLGRRHGSFLLLLAQLLPSQLLLVLLHPLLARQLPRGRVSRVVIARTATQQQTKGVQRLRLTRQRAKILQEQQMLAHRQLRWSSASGQVCWWANKVWSVVGLSCEHL
jgi:hypothetical protein